MNLKKIVLLSSMALAAIAFAVPATASATQQTWTVNHLHLEGNEKFTQAFEGKIRFEVEGVFSYECEVYVELEATAGATAHVRKFEPTTSTCVGTGALAGCELETHTTNLGTGNWHVNVTTNDLLATHVNHSPSGTHITVMFHYKHGHFPTTCPISTSHINFTDITLNVTQTNNTIDSISIANTTNVSTEGVKVSGTLQRVGAAALGLT